MPKWTYMHVRVEGANGVLKPRYVDGQELANWHQLQPLEVFMSEMGEQEWELVSFSPFWSTSYALIKHVDLTLDFIQLIFKRPKG